MSLEIECPSGLAIKVRGLTGKDARYLSDQQLMKKGVLTDHILSNCWEGTLSPGIYKASEEGKIDWSKVLVGDRVYALMQIRIAGKGGDTMYDFPAQCPFDGCRRKFEWTIDLEDLPVQPLSAELKEQFSNGLFDLRCVVPGTEQYELVSSSSSGLVLAKPRRVIIPGSGTQATYRLQTGADEVALHLQTQKKKKNQAKRDGDEEQADNELIDMIAMRTKSVDGVAKEGLADYLEAMSLDELARLLDRYDEQDCGVDTKVEIECVDCKGVYDVNLPFGTDFFFKRTKRTAR